MWPVGLGEGVLRGQQSLCGRAVALSLGVLLEGVRHRDGPVAEVLAVHGLDGGVGGVEAGEVDEGVALGVARVGVAHDLWSLQDDAEGTERVVQQLLVDFWIQVTNEDVGTDVQVFIVRRGFIHSNRFAVQLYHVHDFDGIVSILFTEELHKAIALVLACDPVLRHVCVDHRTSLQEELP